MQSSMTTNEDRGRQRRAALARRPLLAALLTAAAVLACLPAQAALLSARASTAFCSEPPFPLDACEQFTGPVVGADRVEAEVEYFGPRYSTRAEASAEFGALRASVFASDVGSRNGGLTASSAIAQTRFADDLRIVSSLLPVGTPVTLFGGIDLTGSTTLIGSGFSGGPDATLTLLSQIDGFARVYRETRTLQRTLTTGTLFYTVNRRVGDVFDFVGALDVFGRSGFLPGASSVFADYVNTARFFFTADDPTIRVIGASGHDYGRGTVGVVPEPSMVALLAAGLLACWTARRWRRRQ